jgi:hypothetical protein
MAQVTVSALKPDFSPQGLELRACTLSYSHQLYFCEGFFEIGSPELFVPEALNHDPPDLCLLSS